MATQPVEKRLSFSQTPKPNFMNYILAATLGILVGFVIALPAIFMETSRRVKNLPLMVDVHIWRGYKLKGGEVFVVSLLLHLITSAAYAIVYVLFASKGWLIATGVSYSFTSMIVIAMLFWLTLNVIIFPLVGLGFMGFKEEKTAWFETLIALGVESALLWMLIQYYQPYYFL